MNSEQRARKLLAEEVGCAVEDLETAFIQRDDAVRAIARALEASCHPCISILIEGLKRHPPTVTCAVCEELVERIGNGYVPNGSREEQVSLREAALERLTAAKSQTERTTQVDDDAGKDFFVVVAAFVLTVLGTVFLLFLK